MIKKIIKLTKITLLLLIISFGFIKSSKTQTFAENSNAPVKASDGYYEISTVDELYWFAELVNGTLTDGTAQDANANARLMNNIIVNENVLNEEGTLNGDGSNFRAWVPIANNATYADSINNITKYCGVFDGNGKTISGLYYNDEKGRYVGFIGCFGYRNQPGTVKNLTITDSYFNGRWYVGVFGGNCTASTVENCNSLGNYVKSYVSAGGIVAQADSFGGTFQILNCYNSSIVIADYRTAGGIVGSISSGTIVKNCYNIGKMSLVESTYKEYVGAIVGSRGYSSEITNVTNCYYLEGSVERGIGHHGDTDGTIKMSADDFASGKVTYLLNEQKSGDTNVFYQTCGVGYPEFSGEIVYFGYNTDNCSETVKPVYTNDSTNLRSEKAEHGENRYEYNNNGTHKIICSKCKDVLNAQEPCTNINGKCQYCGGCQHLNYTNGFCDECDDYQPAILENGYYEITNAGQLYYFMTLVNSGNANINAKLMDHIIVNDSVLSSNLTLKENTSDLRLYTPIGNASNKFSVVFDGNGFTISGLYYEGDTEAVGLFGYVENGTIKNVALKDTYFKSTNELSKVGGIVGYSSNGTITKIGIEENVLISGNVAGGIVGTISSNTKLENSYNKGVISGNNFIGGLVGIVEESTSVKNCYSIGTVEGSGTNGNIVGKNQGLVENCYFISGTSNQGVGNDEGTSNTLEIEEELFKLGKVTYLLNNKVSNDSNVWKQTLTVNNYPSFTGEIVNYSSRNDKYYNTCEHTKYNNGICSICGIYEEPSLNDENYYEISNLGQFLWFQDKVNSGDTSINGKLMNNIDLSEEKEVGIGNSENKAYSGTFDGNQKVIKINIITDEQYASIFTFVNGASINNLAVEGKITTTQKYAGSIIGKVTNGTVHLTACVSFVTIQSNITGDDHDGSHGGLIGIVQKGTAYINYCGFAGEINGETTINCGGLIGWTATKTHIYNSYVAGTFNLETNDGDTFARCNDDFWDQDLSNCYYLNALSNTKFGSTIKRKEESAFKSGEVTYLLNNAKTDGSQKWYQTCGEGFPTIIGDTVYYGYETCRTDSNKYSNTNLPAEPQSHPQYINGICSVCNAYQEAVLNSDNYYEITNAGQLLWFGSKVNGGNNNINGKLIESIDLKDIIWNVIGTKDKPYKGIFDGNEKEITNFEVNATGNYVGLFGLVEEGTVKNFTIKGTITITGNVTNVGSAVAVARQFTTVDGIISYVNITDNSSEFNIEYLGGVVGVLGSNIEHGTFRAYLKNCTNYGNIRLKKANNVGGIIGMSALCQVENCNNYGNINSEVSTNIGGIIGNSPRGTTLKNSINSGNIISGGNAHIGGIMGHIGDTRDDEASSIYSSSNLGKITYTSEESGSIGGILGHISSYYFGSIKNNYNYGAINSHSNTQNHGALIGYCELLNDYQRKRIENNYYLNTSDSVAYQKSLANNFAKTKEQFATGEVAFFLGNGWGQDLSKDLYPVLGGAVVEARYDFYKQTTNIMGDLSVKYYVIAFDKDFDKNKLVMEFLFLGQITNVKATYEEETGYYTFTLKDINPQCMGDNIKAMLKYDNVVKNLKEEYNVETNLLKLLEESNDELFKKLINSILAYGQASEKYNEYESLNGTYTIDEMEIPESTVLVSAPFSGYTVHFGSLNYIKIRFMLEDGEKIFINNIDMTVKKVKVGDYYTLMTKGILPMNFDKLYTFTITAKDGSEKAKLELSINDYLYKVSQNQSTSTEMKNLVQALYNYGRYTVIYQHQETKVGAHIYKEEYTINKDGTHSRFCVCGYELVELHQHDESTYQCICGDEATLLDLSTYENGDVIDITNSVYIIGDENEYQVTLNILENVTLMFKPGTSGVKLNGSIIIVEGKTLTLMVLGDDEHIISGSITLGNDANLIIEGDRKNENNKLTIKATDAKMAIGAHSGVKAGSITIKNAVIEANGSSNETDSAPAIGVSNATINSITIRNSNVTAVGSSNDSYTSPAIGIGSNGGSIENIQFINSTISLGKLS